MKRFSRREIRALFPIVARTNNTLKEAKKRFPEAPFISESIAINEKFLSYREKIRQGDDQTILDDITESFIKEMSVSLIMALIAIIKKQNEIKVLKELFLESDLEAYRKLTSN